MIKIKIGMPDELLRPNNRPTNKSSNKKYAYAKAAKNNAIEEGYYATLEQIPNNKDSVLQLQQAKNIYASFKMYPKDGRRMDRDNALAACKPHIDGMCKALKINDRKILWSHELEEFDKIFPHIEIKLTCEIE